MTEVDPPENDPGEQGSGENVPGQLEAHTMKGVPASAVQDLSRTRRVC